LVCRCFQICHYYSLQKKMSNSFSTSRPMSQMRTEIFKATHTATAWP
jgi:hypothetical protein